MTDDRKPADAAERRPNVADEPLETGPHGAPQAADPQAGLLTDDPTHDPDAAQPLRPRTGEPFGP